MGRRTVGTRGDSNTVNGELGIESEVVFGGVDCGTAVGLCFTVDFGGVNNGIITDVLTGDELEGEFNSPDKVIDPLRCLSRIEVEVGLPYSRDREQFDSKSNGSCEESRTRDGLNRDPRTNRAVLSSTSREMTGPCFVRLDVGTVGLDSNWLAS